MNYQQMPGNYPIVVSTDEYVASHGKEPFGRGSWAFNLKAWDRATRGDLFFAGPNLTLTQAIKEAKTECRKQGWAYISVAP